MPKYDYKCKTCSNVQEESHGMCDTPEIRCKVCNSPTNKIITKNNIILPFSFDPDSL